LAFDAIAGDFTNVILKNQPPGSTCLVYGPLSGWTVNNISILELFKGKTLGAGFIKSSNWMIFKMLLLNLKQLVP